MLSRHQTLNTFLRCSCVPLRPSVSIASGIENRTRLEAGDVVGSYNAAAAAAGQGVSRVSTSVREDRSEDSALCYNEGTSREHQTLKGRANRAFALRNCSSSSTNGYLRTGSTTVAMSGCLSDRGGGT
ncbi:unnamed protein product [Sphagnum compactum]